MCEVLLKKTTTKNLKIAHKSLGVFFQLDFVKSKLPASKHRQQHSWETYGSVDGSVMSTSGTSNRGFRGFSSLIFTLVMFPWRR